MTRWLRVLAIVVAVLVPRLSRAADLPVIAAGREQEIVALIQPYFGKAILPGYTVGDIDIRPHAIAFQLKGPNGKKGTLLLEHPSITREGSNKSASFTITSDSAGDPEMAVALTALAGVVTNNDKGGFWPERSPDTAPIPAPVRRPHGPVHPILAWRAPALLRDGVILFCAASVFLALHLRRVLREEARLVTVSLFALAFAGAALRLAISQEAAMNVWPYERVVPLARSMFEGPVLPALAAALRVRVYLTDLIFKTTAVIAIVTPFAFFAHARYVLRDARGALFATALLVLLPNHIRFARADSEFIQSLATSSLTFVVLYTALRDRSRAWRGVCFALLPIFSLATYFVRPENLFFYFVDVGAIVLTSGDEAPRRRKLLVFVELTVAAILAFFLHLVANYRATLGEALGIRTVVKAAAILFDVRLNTLINPSITPTGILVLAVVGAVVLVRRGERGRALFLCTWLLGFFVVHSFVVPNEPAMQARYHMHLVTPFLLLAASALPTVVKWPRWALASGAAYLAAIPWIHLRHERDTAFVEMQEFSFLRRAARTIPDGCTVLEFQPAVDLDHPDEVLASKLERMSVHLETGSARRAFRVVNAARLGSETSEGEKVETLSDEAVTLLRNPPACLFVYEGLTCRSHRPPKARIAPACRALHEQTQLQSFASTTVRARLYDEVNGGRLVKLTDGTTQFAPRLEPTEDVPLTLFRVTATPK